MAMTESQSAKASANVRSMKSALAQSIDGSFAKRSVFAQLLGVSESAVSMWCDEANPKEQMPGRWYPITLQVCTDKTFARYLAMLAGGEFHEVPSDVQPIERPTADLMGRTGDLLKSAAAVDRDPTPATFESLDQDTDEMIAAARAVREQARARVSVSMAPPMRRVR